MLTCIDDREMVDIKRMIKASETINMADPKLKGPIYLTPESYI